MSVNVIDTLKPKNGGSFPIVEAVDVFVEGYTSLADAVSHFATQAMIAAIVTTLSGKANTADVNDAVANLQGQINQIVISSSSEAVVAPEVAAARVGYDSTNYTTLKQRLDTESETVHAEIDALDDLTVTEYTISDNRFDNIFDESGYIDTSGNDASSSNFKRTSKYYPLIMGATNYIHVVSSKSTATLTVRVYDRYRNYLGAITLSNVTENGKAINNAYYFRLYTDSTFDGNVYVSPIAFNNDYTYNYSAEKYIDPHKIAGDNVLIDPTETQLAAINSGITSDIVSEIGVLENDVAELDQLTTVEYTISDNRFDNIFDESGYIDTSGNDAASPNYKRTSKYYPLYLAETYYIHAVCSATTSTLTVRVYDQNKNYLQGISLSNITEAGKSIENAYYFRLYTDTSYGGNVYVSPVSFDGDYSYSVDGERKIDASKISDSERYMKLIGKKIVNFGDSLFGNYRGDDSISATLAEITGATVYNAGFGGCQMADRGDSEASQKWNAFAMYALADAITSGTWTAQDEYKSASGIPSYFAETVEMLKGIDFSEIDIITIAYGTNDYTAGQVIDDTAEGFDTTTYIGAFRYAIRKIQTTFPHIRILAITPTWRYFEGGVDSDEEDYGHGTLRQIKDKLIAASQSMRIPVLDSYENLSLSTYNASYYMADRVHLARNGRQMYAGLIDGALCALY